MAQCHRAFLPLLLAVQANHYLEYAGQVPLFNLDLSPGFHSVRENRQRVSTLEKTKRVMNSKDKESTTARGHHAN
jgi:hypothetical protein